MKFPVNSLLTGNLGLPETTSLLTASSSAESATNHGRGPGDVSKAQPAFAAVAVDVVQFSSPLDRVAAGRNRGCDPDRCHRRSFEGGREISAEPVR